MNYNIPEHRAHKLFITARTNARKLKVPFNLTERFILNKIKTGKCERTNIPFDFILGKYKRSNPFSPSIDRKNPNNGYTKKNIRVVVWIYNVCKHEWSDADVYKLAKGVIKNG